MKFDITYITYQTFPANTANSLQTISVIKYLVRNNQKVKLIFPDRSNESKGNIKILQDFYGFNEKFDVEMTSHKYPFKDYKNKSYFKRIKFHVSHFFWSKKIVKKAIEKDSSKIYFTRSDWVLYFLNKSNQKVIFECHQVSRLRKLILDKLIVGGNCEIIYTNDLLKKEFNNNKSSSVIHNAYDEDFFKSIVSSKKSKQVVFVGNLLRFGKDRNIQFLLDSFKDPSLKNYKLIIVGGPDGYKDQLNKVLDTLKVENISLLGRLDRKETIKVLQESEYGVLINSSESLHSTHHTSPLKYFEYLRAELKVIAVDFPAHRALPLSEKITFFKENDILSFCKALTITPSNEKEGELNYKNFSYDIRVKKILNIKARLEGLEPPTL
jgi:hypothetical protein